MWQGEGRGGQSQERFLAEGAGRIESEVTRSPATLAGVSGICGPGGQFLLLLSFMLLPQHGGLVYPVEARPFHVS